VLEHYEYGFAGGPRIYDSSGNGLAQSSYGNRFMFQGRDYLKEARLYDYRNRFYFFPMGRFLQTDPIGFKGDAGNLYRYCGNDPVDRSDPMGLLADHTYERQLWLYGSNFQGSFAVFEQLRHPAGIMMA